MARRKPASPPPPDFPFDDTALADIVAGQRNAAQNEAARWAAVALKQKAELEALRGRPPEAEKPAGKPVPARKR